MNTARKINPLAKSTIALIQTVEVNHPRSSVIELYLRENINKQVTAIKKYALRHGITIDEFVTVRFPLSLKKRIRESVFTSVFRVEKLITTRRLTDGGSVIINDITRLGMNEAEVKYIARKVVPVRGITVIVCDPGITIKPDDAPGAVAGLFSGLRLPSLEKVFQRRNESLKRMLRKKLQRPAGRPRGSTRHVLDRKLNMINDYLDKGYSKVKIASVLGVTRPTLIYFMTTRGIGTRTTKNTDGDKTRR